MTTQISDIAFTPAIKALQADKGSRDAYALMDAKGGWTDRVTDDLAAFIGQRDSLYLATASADGRPYIQHRGGPKGFLKILDEKTLAFADFTGNKQYISAGNLSENDKAYIFLMDYPNRRRIKIWGRAEVVSDEATTAQLFDDGYKARPEQAIKFTIDAWDVNCPQHIQPRFTEEEMGYHFDAFKTRIAELEAENAELRATGAPVPS